MPSFDIREYIPSDSEDDFQALLDAYLAIFNDPENLRYLSFSQRLFEEETVSAWFHDHLRLGAHYLAAVENGGHIIAILVLRINPVEAFELIGLGVRPEAKRSGVGQSLIEEAAVLAEDLGFKAVEVGVFADNREMLRLVLKLDFLPVRMKHHARADGADLVFLKRYL